MDMRKIFASFIFLLCSFCLAMAQTDAATVISEIKASGEALKSFECDFVQTATHPMMKEAMTSKGRMYYQAPSCVRWEYTEPEQMSMVINGSKAMMSADGKSQVVDLNAQKGLSQMSGMMTGLVQGSMLGNDGFDCAVDVSERNYTLTLTPLVKGLKKFLSGIVIVYERDGAYVSEIEMRGKGGDSVTHIKLLNMKKDVDIASDVFKVE